MTERKGSHERLSMLDEHGHRQFIIPAEVRGYWNRWKRKVHFVLLLIFLLLPWIRIQGEQAVLLDIPGRHFVFAGLNLYAHDLPLMFLLLMIFLLGLALVTALWGRVWCGWACPQTVFIERVYRQIEIWVEGTYLQRRALQQAPFSFGKFRKRSLKWALYVLVSSIIAHSFIAYWVGSKTLLLMMSRPPAENWTYFVLVSSITGLLLFNFGWFREQFCLIVCPYGKFQSTMMDSHSVTVMYDEKRGEPRRGSVAKDKPVGDCVSCNRCVQVCPTGIDIRNGIQMECIGCTACVDACDEIMTKVKKPQGLIRYKALTEKKIQWFRPRVAVYFSLLSACLIGLIVILAFHSNLRVEVLRAKNVPYLIRDVGNRKVVQNQFLFRAENENGRDVEIQVSAPAEMEIVLPENPVHLSKYEKKDLPLFIEVRPEQFDFLGRAEVILTFREGEKTFTRKLPLLCPIIKP